MDGTLIIMVCDICGQRHQMGPHRYDGRFISRYQIEVCRSCYSSNWDGWNPDAEKKIILHLVSKILSLSTRNIVGLLPGD